MDTRINAVVLCNSGEYSTKEIGRMYDVDERTIRRWKAVYDSGGFDSLAPKKTGPKNARTIKKTLEARIIRLKGRYPSWGAKRITHQFDLPVSERTVHRVFKKKGLLVRIKPKPQPCKRFQRKHVDSMWQGDTFQFRIKDVGKVHVTGFTDDCSRHRVKSKVYLDKSAKSSINALQWALKMGRIPKQIYLDNGKQFVAKVFKAEMKKNGIKPIYGKPYHPRGRGKIERYHKTLYRELICTKEFKSLSEFKRDLWKFDKWYNTWRKQEILGWKTPDSVYNDPKYFNKNARYTTRKKRTLIVSPNRT
jgi:transposase InsO family protein